MANTNRAFDPNLDKITEHEVVPDFVSRLSIGNNFTNPDDLDEENNPKVIIPAGSKLKDDILTNMIRTFNVSDIEHLDSIKTTYTKVYAGDTSVSIPVPRDNDNDMHTDYLLYRIVQESTGQDVSKCFERIRDGLKIYCMATFDTPASTNDIYKAYFFYYTGEEALPLI